VGPWGWAAMGHSGHDMGAERGQKGRSGRAWRTAAGGAVLGGGIVTAGTRSPSASIRGGVGHATRDAPALPLSNSILSIKQGGRTMARSPAYPLLLPSHGG